MSVGSSVALMEQRVIKVFILFSKYYQNTDAPTLYHDECNEAASSM